MRFFRRAPGTPQRLGVFPGAFNPPTRAHMALARAALLHVDEVVFVLPRKFPHKRWEGAPFEVRLAMLERCVEGEPRFSIASSEGGLFIEIARECREAYGADVRLWFVCGADAAERILKWDYGRPGAIREQLGEYGLLVAPRLSGWKPPEEFGEAIVALHPDEPCEDISSTAVREAIQSGEHWRRLVPREIAAEVEALYRRP